MSKTLCEAVEPRRLLAAITSGVTQTGNADKTFTTYLEAGTDVLIATNATGRIADVNVSLVNPATNTSVGYAVISGAGRTGMFDITASGTYELRIDVGTGSTNTGKWSTTLFARTAGQATDDATGRFVTGKTYAGRAGGTADVDWWSIDSPQDAFVGASFGPTGGASNNDFTLAHVTPDGQVEIGQPGSNESWWTNPRSENWIAGGKQFFVVTAKKASSYSMSFVSLPEARDASVDDHATPKSGQTHSGRITSGDTDVFPIVVKKGAKITATLKAANDSDLQPSLRLVRADGVELSADDDGSSASVSEGAAKSNTVYYLIARGGWLSNGKYNLSYKLSAGDGTGAIDDRGVLNIKGGKENDDFQITQSMSAGTTIVNLNGKVTEYGRGAVQSLNVDSGDGNDRIDWLTTNIRGYVSAGSGNDTVLGGLANDVIVGGAGKNQLYGNDGDDKLRGSGGPDQLIGAGGNDRLYGGGGDDKLDGGPGTDRLWGEDGNDMLVGGAGNDKLYGGRGRDTLSGNAGRDLLDGDADKDTVLGRDSGDTLVEI